MGTSTVACLYPVVFVYSTVLFATYTPRTILTINLLRKRICGQSEPFDDDAADCDEDHVSAEAAILSTWIGLASALPAIFMSGPMGTLANSYGRLYPPRVVLLGAILQFLLVAAVAQYEFKVEWLILGSLFEGLTGSYTSFLMGTSSYIADCNALDSATLSDTDRVERFSFVEAGLSLGILVGPFCGGIFVTYYSFSLFFIIAALLLLLLFVYISTCIPESLPVSMSSAQPCSNDFSSTWSVLKLAFQTRPYRENEPATITNNDHGRADTDFDYKTLPEDSVPAIRLSFISLAFMMSFGSNNAMSQIFVLYTARAWSWSSAAIGAYVSALGGTGFLGLLVLRRMYKCVTGRDSSDWSLMLAGAAGKFD
jgi:MFS family permease